MADGDEKLDIDGNVQLDAHGDELLDDADGTCCFFQARKCSDNTLANLWMAADSIPSLPYYVKRASDNLCYYFDPDDAPSACPNPPLIGTVTAAADCSCAACPSGNKCFSLYTISFACNGLTQSWDDAWVFIGNYCLPEDTSTERTQTFGDSGSCDYQQYVPLAHCCTTDGNCAAYDPAPAPPVPAHLPADCCADCDCPGAVPITATVAFIAAVMCTACYESADIPPASRVSAHVTAGDINHSYTLDKEATTCNYRGRFAGVTFHLHCTNGSLCNEGDPGGDINIFDQVFIQLFRTGPNLWRIIAKPSDGFSEPGTLYFDSGDFAWDPCSGATATPGNLLTSCDFTGTFAGFGTCPNPDTAAHGGSAMVTLDFP